MPTLLKDQLEQARAHLAMLERRAASASCAELGHDWYQLGGMNCGCGDCSVPVNSCRRCGDCDYGDNDVARQMRTECADDGL